MQNVAFPMKDLGSVIIQYVVACGNNPIGVKNEMFVKIHLDIKQI
jgi:hypothetical protein